MKIQSSKGKLATACALRLLLALLLAHLAAAQSAPRPCDAPYDSSALPTPRRPTFDIGGLIAFPDDIAVKRGFDIQGGGGILVSDRCPQYKYYGEPQRDRHWSLYITGNALFSQSGLIPNSAISVATSNPQNPQLLSATSGTARYYAATAEPVFRYRFCRIATGYLIGGFGVLRRDLDFSGTPLQGTIVNGPSSVAASFTGNSGVWDMGGGLSFGPVNRTAGVSYYFEVRRMKGLGVNGATTLFPLSAGIRW